MNNKPAEMIKPATDLARKAVLAGKVKKISLKIKMKGSK